MMVEVTRALEELAAVIGKLQFIAAELTKAKAAELKKQRDQAAKELGDDEPKKDG
jgi:hypothetical protein